MSLSDIQANLIAAWRVVLNFFLAPEWSVLHGFILLILAGVAVVWLITGWPLQVKVATTAAATLVMLALMISIGSIGPDTWLGDAAGAAGSAGAEAEGVALRFLEPVRRVGQGIGAAARGVWEAITGAPARFQQ